MYRFRKKTEIVNNVNWIMLTTITVTLILSNLFSIGLAFVTDTTKDQAWFNKLEVQTSNILKQIPGDPNSLAIEAIPEITYLPNYDDYNYDNPYLPGMYSSFNILMLSFSPETTIGNINLILREVDAEIVGTRPGIVNMMGSALTIRVPTTNYLDLESIMAFLDSNPLIEIVSFDVGMTIPYYEPENDDTKPQRLPTSNQSANNLSDWTWELEPKGGDWGLEYTKVPVGE